MLLNLTEWRMGEGSTIGNDVFKNIKGVTGMGGKLPHFLIRNPRNRNNESTLSAVN